MLAVKVLDQLSSLPPLDFTTAWMTNLQSQKLAISEESQGETQAPLMMPESLGKIAQ